MLRHQFDDKALEPIWAVAQVVGRSRAERRQNPSDNLQRRTLVFVPRGVPARSLDDREYTRPRLMLPLATPYMQSSDHLLDTQIHRYTRFWYFKKCDEVWDEWCA